MDLGLFDRLDLTYTLAQLAGMLAPLPSAKVFVSASLNYDPNWDGRDGNVCNIYREGRPSL